MGLDTSHGCWHGAYSSFHKFRCNLAAAAVGIDLEAMEGFGGKNPWPPRTAEPLVSLLNHSDCEGSIPIEELIPLADRLDEVAALFEADPLPELTGVYLGGTAADARTFARGCRLAAERGEPVDFH